MRMSNFEDFMEKYNLKDITMNESELERVYKNPIYPKNSKKYSDKGFVTIDNESQGGTHWTAFYVKITNHITLIVSVVNQISFYLIIYLNQKYIINIKFRIIILNYVAHTTHTFLFN